MVRHVLVRFDQAGFGRESIHGAVESLVRSPQIRRHQVGIVEVGQGSVRMSGLGPSSFTEQVTQLGGRL